MKLFTVLRKGFNISGYKCLGGNYVFWIILVPAYFISCSSERITYGLQLYL